VDELVGVQLDRVGGPQLLDALTAIWSSAPVSARAFDSCTPSAPM
jgi:hypothetical protein